MLCGLQDYLHQARNFKQDMGNQPPQLETRDLDRFMQDPPKYDYWSHTEIRTSIYTIRIAIKTSFKWKPSMGTGYPLCSYQELYTQTPIT